MWRKASLRSSKPKWIGKRSTNVSDVYIEAEAKNEVDDIEFTTEKNDHINLHLKYQNQNRIRIHSPNQSRFSSFISDCTETGLNISGCLIARMVSKIGLTSHFWIQLACGQVVFQVDIWFFIHDIFLLMSIVVYSEGIANIFRDFLNFTFTQNN